ncbi:MAG: type I polyketide synthase, partial [Pyrinomonadaceae bacterium]
MLVLARLSDAERQGHPILGLIKGSAVNQDGASNGLTAPNGPSQERVIRQALANARLKPTDIDAVEAHGTGTTLGDPIEAGALLATYGQDRDEPLYLGSIKSNIGHTQAAAGVAGVIKALLAMREGVLPKTLHVDEPSSKVDWEAGQIELLTEERPWEVDGRPRRAAVSSFGISGTNAHVILEGAPEPVGEGAPGASGDGAPSEATPLPLIPLALSAKTKEALEAQAKRLATHIQEHPELSLTDVAYSLTATRSAFEHRAVALGEGREELLESLSSLAEGKEDPATTLATAKTAKLAYLLTGQGSQRAGMGKELYEAYPAYREAIDQICELVDQELGAEPLKEVLLGSHPKAAELITDTTYAQPALFALEVALHRLLSEKGMKPQILAGHSVGEIAAAQISGVLSLPDAAKLIAARGKLMGELPAGGAMAAIEATEAEVTEAIAAMEQELSLAAVNGPRAVVISGKEQAVEQVRLAFEQKGAKTKRLEVSHAFHSPLIEPMLAPFEEVAQSLDYQEPKIPIVSDVTGELLSSEQATDPAYWVTHVREPVRFADAIATLKAQGASAFLELGPDPVLSAIAAECLGEEELTLAPALREGRAETEILTTAIAALHCS